MISLLIAGGMSVAAASQSTEWPDINNHTLRGEPIPSSNVVCRNRWGTPMLPDGKGGYSLIAKINPDFISQSLIIPPRTTDMVAFRPLPPMTETSVSEVPALPAPSAPSMEAPAPAATVDPFAAEPAAN